MRAECIEGKGSGGERMALETVLPLDMPFGIDIFPIHACNFKCKYCLFSLDADQHGFQFDTDVMSYDLYKKCVDDMKGFPGKLKMLRFVGIGEPLLHKQIHEMVKYTVDQGVAEQVEIITNGALLSHEMSDRLIDAGLSRLFISVQGLTEKAYQEVADVKINMDEFLDNIRYFYDHRGKTRINIKIIDCGLEGEKDRQAFFDMFGDICDTITIEHASPVVSKVDYTDILDGQAVGRRTVRGYDYEEVSRCPFPFYLMQINPDGSVYPCCSAESLKSLGNCNVENVVDIWKGKSFNAFRRRMLKGALKCGGACSTCNAYKYSMFQEDKIGDKRAEELMKLYK